MKSLLTFVIMLSLAALCPAQITIHQGDQAPFGTTWLTHTVGGITFDVGSSGANQTWTFGEYTYDAEASGAVVDPSTTTHYASFPTSNWAMTSGDEGNAYSYLRIESGGAYMLGMAASLVGAVVLDNPALAMQLPCTYGTQWTFVSSYSAELYPGYVSTVYDSVLCNVDGWGTLTTQFGSQSVLRCFQHTFSRTEISPLPPSESEYVGYIWYGTNGLDAASVTSDDGVTDPNFTTGFFEVMGPAEAADPTRGPLAKNFRVEQNYPNPFNPTTTLPVDLTKNANVQIRIYDETGRLVMDENLNLPAGQHQIPVNGSQWSNGTYFANVSAGADQQTVKMQLVK